MSQSGQEFYGAISALLRSNKAEEASARLVSWIENNPDDEVGMSLLGSALMRQGKSEEALRVFQDAIEKHSQSFAAHGDLGFAQAQNRDRVGAIGSFSTAVQFNPSFYPGWVFLSRLQH